MTTLHELIVEQIDADGPLPFSRYMELALYHPELGFYADGGAGRRRDFITSPEVGPLFGAVVARAIDSWWDDLGRPDPFTFVEAGAGAGTLSRTVLRCELRCRDALHYVAVEISASQRALHPDTVTSTPTMPANVGDGVVFANELLDNLPFDVLSFIDGRGWREVRVGHDGAGHLVEELVAADGPRPAAGGAGELRVPLQHGAHAWLERSLQRVQRGRVVVIDYAVARYPAEAGRDWLRTYSTHGRAGSPLVDPGTKDITTDVDLAALASIARPDVTRSQGTWLRGHGIDALVAEGREHWQVHVAAPDVKAFEMRSRATEADALLDQGGLGGFTVAEWVVSRSSAD